MTKKEYLPSTQPIRKLQLGDTVEYCGQDAVVIQTADSPGGQRGKVGVAYPSFHGPNDEPCLRFEIHDEDKCVYIPLDRFIDTKG